MNSLFTYLDHKKLLIDLAAKKKDENPAFSQRIIARKLGLKSSAAFRNILNGRNKITGRQIKRFVEMFNLSGAEAEYFELVVQYSQTDSAREKRAWLEDIHLLREHNARSVGPYEFEIYEEWYYLAIRALMSFYTFDGSYTKLANQINPPIKAHQARKAVSLLKKLGFLRVTDTGDLEQTFPAGKTEATESKSIALGKFQKDTLDLAKSAIDDIPLELREISTLTLSLCPEIYELAKQELKALRKKLAGHADRCDKADRVYQFNFQVFPISKIR